MQSKVVWLTGLSGTGKSTLCKILQKKLKKRFKTLLIDGDIFRRNKKYKQSFTRNSIKKNNLSIINHIKKEIHKYDYILVAVISPIAETRKFAKKIFKKNYFEFYLFCNLKILVNRDTKGLYKKAMNKKSINLAIISGFKKKITKENFSFFYKN